MSATRILKKGSTSTEIGTIRGNWIRTFDGGRPLEKHSGPKPFLVYTTQEHLKKAGLDKEFKGALSETGHLAVVVADRKGGEITHMFHATTQGKMGKSWIRLGNIPEKEFMKPGQWLELPLSSDAIIAAAKDEWKKPPTWYRGKGCNNCFTSALRLIDSANQKVRTPIDSATLSKIIDDFIQRNQTKTLQTHVYQPLTARLDGKQPNLFSAVPDPASLPPSRKTVERMQPYITKFKSLINKHE